MDISLEPTWWSRNTGDEDDQSINHAEIEHQSINQRKHFIDNFRYHPVDQSINHSINQSILHCQTLVWSTDAFTSTFIQTTFPSLKYIGKFDQSINQTNIRSANQSIKQSNKYDDILVYQSRDTVILLSFMEINQSLMQPTVSCINKLIDYRQCIVLDTQPSQSFVDLSINQSVTENDDVIPPLIRCIATSNYDQSNNQSIKPLTVPMMLHSLTAAILTEGEINSLINQSHQSISQSCIAYINFYSQHYVNESLAGLVQIFESNADLKAILTEQSINQAINLSAAVLAWKKARSAISDLIRKKSMNQSTNQSNPGAGFGLGVSGILSETSTDLFL